MENNFDNAPGDQEIQTGGQEIQETAETGLNKDATDGADVSPAAKYTDPNAGYSQNNNYTQGSYNQSYGNTNYQQSQGYGNTNYQQSQSYGNTNYQQQYQDNYNYNVGNNTGYNQNYSDGEDTSPMSMGDWVITLILMAIPCLNIVFCCVWAFSKTGNVNRRNFCRAELIFIGISIILSIILVVVIMAAGFGTNRYYYY